MIHIHTDELLAAVSSLRAANGEVDKAAQHLLQITSHNDWTCKERYVINQNADELRTAIKRLQQDTDSYLQAAANAADAFVTEENGVKTLFPGVDAIISRLLSIGGDLPAALGAAGKGAPNAVITDDWGIGDVIPGAARIGNLKEAISSWTQPVNISGGDWRNTLRSISTIPPYKITEIVPRILDFSSLAF